MISVAKGIGSTKNVGVLAVEVRLAIGESGILSSVLFNAEAFAHYSKKEIEELEKLETIQARRLKMATPKERKEELERDAWAAEVLEHSMKEAEFEKDAKAVAELEEKMKIKEKPEKQEKAEDGGPDKPDSI